MQKKIYPLLFFFLLIIPVIVSAQSSGAAFEGILTTRISMGGVDLGTLTESIDYSKGDVGEQTRALFKNIPPQDMERLKSMLEANPMMGMALMMTPPRATMYLKEGIALVKTKGFGYEIQHYHNLKSDEAFLYTASLIRPGEAVTAAYKPSEGYDELFTDDKRITAEGFHIERPNETATIAGHPCVKAVYTPKTTQPTEQAIPGIPMVQLRKLVVYTSEDLPKTINFSHPYYLPEDHGVMRIDVFMDDSDQPTMVYEITSVEPTAVDDSLLQAKKTEPLYRLTDTNYGMQLLGIMMGGMGTFQGIDGEED
ncbi:hypothetical protein [Parapedobacter lycopersici]|uniref:hypothetical protein n=1 Tax=Parapedobacter lycopersici TaxID=1864939 RepID=UPI00214DC145|nr:hypothetical protein [Parapedobacter lycopersici]